MFLKILNRKQFDRDLRDWSINHVSEIGKATHKAVTHAVYQGIVERTPVLTGRARHNWFPTLGAPAETAVEETAGVSVTGEPMTGEERARIKTVTSQLDALPLGAETVYITNNLQYIQGLEEGRSPKSLPNAMVQGTIINTLDGLQITIKPKGG